MPLHYAAEKNSIECLTLLLSHGAEVNVHNDVSNSMNYELINSFLKL